MNEFLFQVAISTVKSLIIIVALLTGFAYMTLFERKVAARIQIRFGPNRVGPFGLFQPLADGIKLFFKEDVMPRGADRWVYLAAPCISAMVALAAFAVIPIGPPISIAGRQVGMYLSDAGIGILYVLAVGSLGVYGITLAGWASNNKYSLLGGIRASAQMISYELSLGLSIMGVVMIVGSTNMTEIVEYQSTWPMFLLQPLGFLLYLTSGIAETNRAPFDLPEAESELVAGYHTEYSGMKFALFYMAEYINMITVSSIATTLYLGGYKGPIADGPWWFLLKVVTLLFFYVWVRATLPRLRYDRLMNFGWRILLPLALVNVMLTAAGILVLG
ncbi:MAG: NADH-quinone oxidoreductase subunit NuoH [Chloroflexota bacterium]|nr:MAG: NADH-quinone oxidoreductase subunit NuoH [Chloroflexota bacterium]